MINETKQTAVEQFIEQLEEQGHSWENASIKTIEISIKVEDYLKLKEQAKEMEKEQIGYTKEDVLTAGEMGEINTYDTKHIVSYLDEAKQFNEKYGGNK